MLARGQKALLSIVIHEENLSLALSLDKAFGFILAILNVSVQLREELLGCPNPDLAVLKTKQTAGECI